LEGWEIRIGHVGVLKDALTGLGLSGDVDKKTGEPPIASAMRFLDKGDDEGLANLFSAHGLDPSNTEPLRALASLEGGAETLGPARALLSSMDGVSLEALDELEMTLTALAALAPAPPALAVDLTVARGLDYYTGMVFEVKVAELGGEGQVLGGGSYKLLHLFGLPDLDPCCGFGLGFDRVLLALEAQAEASGRKEAVPGETDSRPYIAIAPNKADHLPLLPLVASLRESGARVELLLTKKNYGRIIKWTEGIGASHLLVVKPEDLAAGTGRLIDFNTGDRSDVKLTVSSVLDAL
jgi:histidyl-tRNA synthetase